MQEEISLEEILNIIKRKLKLILMLSFLGILTSCIYTFFLVTPNYESTSRIVVNQTQNTNQNITNTDIQTNLNLINTYQSIIKEPIILEDVIKNTGSDLTVNELSSKVSIQIQDNSLVFGVTVNDDNPYVAAEYANSIADTFEKKIGEILEVQSVTILSEAVPNLNPVSPIVTMNLVVGLFFGMILGIVSAFTFEKMDKRVKDSKIIDEMKWTNLGSINEMSISEVKETRISDKNIRNQRMNNLSSSRKRV